VFVSGRVKGDTWQALQRYFDAIPTTHVKQDTGEEVGNTNYAVVGALG
jgi:hypothetical protein